MLVALAGNGVHLFADSFNESTDLWALLGYKST